MTSQNKKKILIIQGNPDKDSFCHALATSYKKGASGADADVKEICVGEIEFNPLLAAGYKKEIKLEQGLIDAQQQIKWADHLVFVYPTWWGTMPALLKGFIDRTFVPGFGFRYRKDSVWWDKLLTGKSARLIVTMDTPPWYYRLIYRSPGHHAMKKSTLEFCGIKPVKITSIGSIKQSTMPKRESWLAQVENLGGKME